MNDPDFTRTMAPETAVQKAEEALNVAPGGGASEVAALAAAMMVREGLVAVARAIVSVSGGGSPDTD